MKISFGEQGFFQITSATSVAKADTLLLLPFRSGFHSIKQLDVWLGTLPGDHLVPSLDWKVHYGSLPSRQDFVRSP